MKTTRILLCMLLAINFACSDKKEETKPSQQLPKVLEKDSDEFDLGSLKRGSGNLVDELYDALAEKDPELKKVEDQIKALHETEYAKDFENYNHKNTWYYKGGKSYASSITDSVLKKKMVALLQESESGYTNSIAVHTGLIKEINGSEMKLEDLHTALKIVYTLPVIEKYQKEKLPPATPLKNYKHKTEKAITKIDSLLDKY